MQKTRSVLVNNTFLDNENPRHDPIDNEPEIIAHLLAVERVKQLAVDIAQFGLSPLDRMAVIAHATQRSKFVVIEGNRRLCAIKLLADPERASNEPARKIFRDLRNSSTHDFQSIDVVVFDDREEAQHWLALRHEGALDGAGTRAWDADQKTRFNRTGKGDNPNALALHVIDYAFHRKLITEEQKERINLTTLTRFLSNPLFRDALGLVSNKKISINSSQSDFDAALKRFLSDSLKKDTPVHSRTNKAEREKYAQALKDEGVSPAKRVSEPVDLNPSTGEFSNTHIREKKPERDNRSPDHRASVIPVDFVCHIKDKIQKRVYDELKKIDHGEFSFSAAYLLRAMVELTTKAYCKKHRIPVQQELHVLVGKVADHLQQTGIPAKELKALRVMANNRDVGYSPESLGASIHGGSVPQKVELCRYWDTMEGGIKHMLDRSN